MTKIFNSLLNRKVISHFTGIRAELYRTGVPAFRALGAAHAIGDAAEDLLLVGVLWFMMHRMHTHEVNLWYLVDVNPLESKSLPDLIHKRNK